MKNEPKGSNIDQAAFNLTVAVSISPTSDTAAHTVKHSYSSYYDIERISNLFKSHTKFSSRVEITKASHRVVTLFDGAMILLYVIIEIAVVSMLHRFF